MAAGRGRIKEGYAPFPTSTTMRSSRIYPDASSDNPAGTSKSNDQFQRNLNAMIQGDNEYYTSPTLARLCEVVARIMHQWEALTGESNRMGGHILTGTSSTTSKAKAAKTRNDASVSAESSSAATGRTCQGCNRANHTREFCRLRFHPDFNREGPWAGTYRPRFSSRGRHELMARCGPELRSRAIRQDLRSRAGLLRRPPSQEERQANGFEGLLWQRRREQ